MIFGNIILEKSNNTRTTSSNKNSNKNDYMIGNDIDDKDQNVDTQEDDQDNEDSTKDNNDYMIGGEEGDVPTDDGNDYMMDNDDVSDTEEPSDGDNQSDENSIDEEPTNTDEEPQDDNDNDYMMGDDQNGEDDTGSDSQDDTGTDGTEMSTNVDDELKTKEKELFSNLSEPQMEIKIGELKSNYTNLYNTIEDIIEKVKRIPCTVQNTKVLDFIINKLSETLVEVNTYAYTTFDTKTYIQNLKQYNYYILILKNIEKLFKEIQVKNN